VFYTAATPMPIKKSLICIHLLKRLHGASSFHQLETGPI